jgi:hypothetical protein
MSPHVVVNGFSDFHFDARAAKIRIIGRREPLHFTAVENPACGYLHSVLAGQCAVVPVVTRKLEAAVILHFPRRGPAGCRYELDIALAQGLAIDQYFSGHGDARGTAIATSGNADHARCCEQKSAGDVKWHSDDTHGR